jgi:hypothetical protein
MKDSAVSMKDSAVSMKDDDGLGRRQIHWREKHEKAKTRRLKLLVYSFCWFYQLAFVLFDSRQRQACVDFSLNKF